MDNKQLVLILAVAAFVTVVGVGALLAQPKDDYYNYVTSMPVQMNYSQSLPITVTLSEKNGILRNCVTPGPPQYYTTQPNYCQSYTYLNARSIHVNIDGTEVVNFNSYPLATGGVSLSSPLPDVGAVSCFGAISPCSVTSDQNRNGDQFHRAYFFGRHMDPQTSLDGTNLFILTLPFQYLTPGNHTVELYYFAETTSHPPDTTASPEYLTRLGGQQYGDQNQKYNYYERFTVSVSSPVSGIVYVNNTVFVQNQTTINELNAQIAALQAQGGSNTLVILIVAAAAIIAWKVVLKK